MRDRVVALIESMQADGGPIEVITERVMPDTWDNAVVAFLATPGAFADLSLPEYLNRVVQERLPLLPIVDDIRRFNFRAIPQSFAAIGERNAKGLQPDDGKGVEAAM
ncbi:MAG: hypothetical protein JO284_08825, partial [Planctomycetaceae bacterium]|nr:hypothetical protein [Planctomycetaceae bacterium]